MLSKYKSDFNPYFVRIFRPLFIIHPNIITILGIIPSLLFFYLLINNAYFWALVSLMLTILDAADGIVARATGRVTKFGALLDSTLDRVADSLYITAFGFAGLVAWDLVIILLILSYLISYIRSRAELAGKGEFTLNIGIIERGERVVLLGIAVLLLVIKLNFQIFGYDLLEALFLLIITMSLVTVIQRMLGAYEKLKVNLKSS